MCHAGDISFFQVLLRRARARNRVPTLALALGLATQKGALVLWNLIGQEGGKRQKSVGESRLLIRISSFLVLC